MSKNILGLEDRDLASSAKALGDATSAVSNRDVEALARSGMTAQRALVNRVYEKQTPQLAPTFDLFDNNNPLAMPPDNMYATFSHIYKFLTKGNTTTPLQSLLKIKKTPETIQNLNNEKYGGDENNDFKEKLVNAFNKIDGFSTRLGFLGLGENKFHFDFQDNSLPDSFIKKLIANQNTTGCYTGKDPKNHTPPLTRTFHKMFNEDVQVSNFIEIAPQIVDAVRNYNLKDLSTPLTDVPIYFIIKTDAADIVAHITSFIYFKNSFYSFGIGGGKNSVIFPVDNLSMIEDDRLGFKLYAGKFNDPNDVNGGIFPKNQKIKALQKQYEQAPNEALRIELNRQIDNYRFLLNKLKYMPWIGNSIIDMGVLTQTHIDRYNDVLQEVDDITIDFCIRPDEENRPNMYEFINYFAPRIIMKSSYGEVCIQSPNKDLNRALPKKINCTTGVEFIFESTLSCRGSSLDVPVENFSKDSFVIKYLKNLGFTYFAVPGNCRRQVVYVNRVTGVAVSHDKPLTYEEVEKMFTDIYYAREANFKKGKELKALGMSSRVIESKKITLKQFIVNTHQNVYPILMNYFLNKRKCEKLVPDGLMESFIRGTLPGAVKFVGPVDQEKCIDLFTPLFEARDRAGDEKLKLKEPTNSFLDWVTVMFTEVNGGSRRKTSRRKTYKRK